MVNEQLSNQLRITVGDIGISVTANNNRFKIDNAYRPFLSRGHPEVILRIHYEYIPQIELGEKIFDSQRWGLYRSNEKVVLRILHPQLHSSFIMKLGIFQPDFTSGDIYAGNESPQNGFPLNYPLDQILMINLLSQGRGILIHSCGIDSDGEGMLFAGSSGAGKSVIAKLGINKKGAKVLSDDRIIVRKLNSRFWMYGTPWHGDAKICSPERAPLQKIFFLKHAKKNAIKEINSVEATSRLVVCSFPTFWDKKGMEFTLSFCSELAEKIPCYELGFVPDKSVLEFVKD